MTLHWWMHWFWVTLLLLNAVAGNPLPTSGSSAASDAPESPTTALVFSEDDSSKQNYRVAKAIGIGANNRSGVIDEANNSDKGSVKNSVLKKPEELRMKDSNGTIDSSSQKKNESRTNQDSKITWISTANRTSRTGVNAAEAKKLIVDEYKRNSSSEEGRDPLAVLPLHEATPTRFKLVLNKTKFIPSTNLNNDSQDSVFNKSELDVEISGKDDFGNRFLATAASILQGISDSPRLSRARSASSGDYQQDEQQEIRQERKQDKADGFGNSTSTAVDIAAVTGSCLATIILVATMGSLGFVMYRRRYMNPPQTLNSDKCSNPDSSGYIDDSTIRDNSEEMYSLDNDSFLNSLEAMTIQNYWTDSVKHTKL